MIKASIFEAKTNLSNLLKQAQRGEVVTITSGRGKTPVARLRRFSPLRRSGLARSRPPVSCSPSSSLSRYPKRNLSFGMGAVSEGPAGHLHGDMGDSSASLP